MPQAPIMQAEKNKDKDFSLSQPPQGSTVFGHEKGIIGCKCWVLCPLAHLGRAQVAKSTKCALGLLSAQVGRKPSAHLTWRNRLGYPAHTGLISPSVCLSVCLSVRPFIMKTRRIFTWELKSGCPRGVFVHCPSPPNIYSYVRKENSGSTRKFVEIYLLFTFISNLILAILMQSVNGLKEPF
jgi:hypothetical protein